MRQKRSTGPSRVVPHRSTTPARTCLTSLFGWEAVSQADVAALKKQSECTNMISVALQVCSRKRSYAKEEKFEQQIV